MRFRVEARAGVLDDEVPTALRSRGGRHARVATRWGVAQDVAEEDVEQLLYVVAIRIDGEWRVVKAQLDRSSLSASEDVPEGHAFAHHLREVGAPLLRLPALTAGLGDHTRDDCFEVVDGGRDARRFVPVLESLGVEAECSERCAESVREVGGVLAFGLHEVADAEGERVEAPGSPRRSRPIP